MVSARTATVDTLTGEDEDEDTTVRRGDVDTFVTR